MNARDPNTADTPVVISSRADAVAPPAHDETNSVRAEPVEAPAHPSTSSGRTGKTERAAGVSRHHESARAQVAGGATYIDDIPEVRGTLHAAPVCSPVAHGKLRGMDAKAALAMPGVRGVFSAVHIPGDPMLAAFAHDEPVFATDTVQFLGQVVALVVADDVMTARRAARLVTLDIEPLPAVINVHEAHAQKSYVLPPVHVKRGDAAAALKRAPHTLQGQFEVGGQEHFYLEGQVAYVLPLEQNQWWVYTSTQHPGEVQHWVSHALGLANHAVTVECRRMGGGFGGKETQAGHLAVWAAIAANQLKCPVKLRLDRDDDFMITGKRHPFAYHYRAGFDDSGLLCGLELEMLANCGFSADLSGPVADRAIFHADNAYFLEDVAIASYRCKTNTQSHTAFRGFGGPQGVIVIERILSDIARRLGLDPLDVRLRNLYSDEPTTGALRQAQGGRGKSVRAEPVKALAQRNVTHYQMPVEDNILEPLMTALAQTSHYRERRDQIAAWNAKSPIIKKGMALTPVKFGISFTATLFNQAGALVHVYTDGSVQVNHGGTEMGQGLNTKVAAIVADELGVPFEQVMSTAADTSKVPNASATAASSGTDLNGRAAQFAARHVRDNLAAFVSGLDGCGAGAVRFEAGQVITPKTTRAFNDVAHAAYANRIQLWSDGFYRTPKIHYDKTTMQGRPFYYFAYGAAVTEVAIDTLTGESRVLKVDILHDVGRSINPAIDIGQIEGGFVQGMGWLTTEQLVWNDKGYLQTHAPSTYKIPATGDIPEHFKIDLWPEPNREDNVHGSKAVGEPPFMLAISVFEALRDAVAQAGGQPEGMNAPGTAEEVLRAVG
ncbi:xanthine dehydrogenase molybdopterin binding subunit [Hydrogenophaga sp.]|uniref:xanthine dehydrogenase molybdopterin binding subunit n=1 Tax=Hydrogenophaga sp. TaxID=1904254 RepID=UPI002FC6994A